MGPGCSAEKTFLRGGHASAAFWVCGERQWFGMISHPVGHDVVEVAQTSCRRCGWHPAGRHGSCPSRGEGNGLINPRCPGRPWTSELHKPSTLQHPTCHTAPDSCNGGSQPPPLAMGAPCPGARRGRVVPVPVLGDVSTAARHPGAVSRPVLGSLAHARLPEGQPILDRPRASPEARPCRAHPAKPRQHLRR